MSTATAVSSTLTVQSGPMDSDYARDRAIKAYVGDRIAAFSGYPASFCHGHVVLTTGLGLTLEQVQRVVATIASEAQTDPEFDGAASVTAGDLARWVRTPPSSWSSMATVSAPPSLKVAPVQTVSMLQTATQRDADPYVVTGISLGLPGMDRVFSEDAFEKLVRGETCISEVSDEYKQRLLDKNIVRLIKGRDGSVNMDQATVFGDIPQLAGLKGAFDLAEEFGIDPKAIVAWDISTQLAVAAGLLALRDAGIPLTPVEQVGKGGLRLIRNWQVLKSNESALASSSPPVSPDFRWPPSTPRTTAMMVKVALTAAISSKRSIWGIRSSLSTPVFVDPTPPSTSLALQQPPPLVSLRIGWMQAALTAWSSSAEMT